MNIKTRYLAAIAVAMLMTAGTAAAINVAGPGGYSCGKFMVDTEVSERASAIYFSWAQGYLTGLNIKYAQSPNAVDLTDIDGQQYWLKNYCKENSLDFYIKAVTKLWIELRVKQKLEPDIRDFPKD